MPISESQLSTWANQGSTTNSARTYEIIKNSINRVNWNPDLSYEVYLQGSYRNGTNIYGNSDVDIVVELTSTFSSDLSKLDDVGMEVWRSFSEAKYSLAKFKETILEQLKSDFGTGSVKNGNKAITVDGNGSRLEADVLVCNSYRKYSHNYGAKNLSYVEGIIFKESDTGFNVMNYPKVHYRNGTAKNEANRTNGRYKPVVRIFRNIKAHLANNGVIDKKIAPSYFVECLLYNGLNQKFYSGNYQTTIYNLLDQFVKDFHTGAHRNYVVQNEQRELFGTGDQQWTAENANIFLKHAINLYNNK